MLGVPLDVVTEHGKRACMQGRMSDGRRCKDGRTVEREDGTECWVQWRTAQSAGFNGGVWRSANVSVSFGGR